MSGFFVPGHSYSVEIKISPSDDEQSIRRKAEAQCAQALETSRENVVQVGILLVGELRDVIRWRPIVQAVWQRYVNDNSPNAMLGAVLGGGNGSEAKS